MGSSGRLGAMFPPPVEVGLEFEDVASGGGTAGSEQARQDEESRAEYAQQSYIQQAAQSFLGRTGLCSSGMQLAGLCRHNGQQLAILGSGVLPLRLPHPQHPSRHACVARRPPPTSGRVALHGCGRWSHVAWAGVPRSGRWGAHRPLLLGHGLPSLPLHGCWHGHKCSVAKGVECTTPELLLLLLRVRWHTTIAPCRWQA